MIQFIDIHSHKRNYEENVLQVLNVQLPTEELPSDTFFSAGWHPFDIENVEKNEIESELQKVISHEKILALGECGLDKRSKTPIEEQINTFKMHIKYAEQHNKPLIIHCVRAYYEIIHVLKKEKFKGNIVLHGFTGNKEAADKFMEYNTWFSFGKQLFNQETKLHDLLRKIPADRLFLETDEADYSINELYIRTSKILDIPVEELENTIKRNFNKLVGYGLVR